MHKISEIGFILAYSLAASLVQLCGGEAEVTILISFFYIQLCGEHCKVVMKGVKPAECASVQQLYIIFQDTEDLTVPHFSFLFLLLFFRVEKKKKDSDNVQSQKDESSKKKPKPPSSSAGPKLDIVK